MTVRTEQPAPFQVTDAMQARLPEAEAGNDPVPALDAECAAAVEEARAAVEEVASEDAASIESGKVGDYLGVRPESERMVTHAFAATLRGYRGWYWAVTVGRAPGFAPTVAEVVLLPGDEALLAPAWVPWSERLQPGDLSPGDVLPTPADDPRLVPSYVLSDEVLSDTVADTVADGVSGSAAEDVFDMAQFDAVAFELGLGRVRVLSRFGRLDAAERWQAGEGGPDTPMARQAPAPCGTCGFFLPLAGSLRAAFGACANELSTSDGHIVTVDHGCGAHSEAVAEPADELGEVYEDDAIVLLEINDGDREAAAAGPVVSEAEAGDSAAGDSAAVAEMSDSAELAGEPAPQDAE